MKSSIEKARRRQELKKQFDLERSQLEGVLELQPVEIEALELLGDLRFSDAAGPACVARYCVFFALLHPTEMGKWLSSIARYSTWEGVNQQDHLTRSVAINPAYKSKRALAKASLLSTKK